LVFGCVGDFFEGFVFVEQIGNHGGSW
jgi:hypothetical protein